MTTDRVRVIAVAIILKDECLLCMTVLDPDSGETHFRPLGGQIEFGERAADAVVRELREELGREIEVVEHLGTSENIFEVRGEVGHEYVAQFHARFAQGHEPEGLFPLKGIESDGSPIEAHWLLLTDALNGAVTLYPAGLSDRLASWLESGRLAAPPASG